MPAEMLRSLPTSIPPLDYTVIQYHLALGPLQCSVSLVGKANISFGETLSGIELDSTDLGNKLKIVNCCTETIIMFFCYYIRILVCCPHDPTPNKRMTIRMRFFLWSLKNINMNYIIW